ncbi:MAG TPA: hypothetical protein VHI52_13735, partial [Verrucomicrobiae bacterium]|nr:hypothetical protein [Verrucomicrobiae bacterium]
MKKLPPLACALGLLLPASGGPLHAAVPNPYKQPDKSVSASGQFVVYCENVHMRLSVASYCEEAKAGIQDFIGQTDNVQRATWKIPIVVNLQRPEAVEPNAPLSRVTISNIEGGGRRIELDVTLRGDLARIHFQQQIVHCILLEMEYRDKGELKPPIIDPPEWLVEGLCAFLGSRTAEIDTDIYKTLLANGDLPTLKDFLSQATPGMNETTLRLYQAYAFGFVQLLQGLQNGPTQIAQYIHDLPLGSDSPSDDLLKHFPALGGSPENLEKWWTLSMARLAS